MPIYEFAPDGIQALNKTTFSVLQLHERRDLQHFLRTFRYLVGCGISPEIVAKHCGPRANRALISVVGEVGYDDFVRLATAARAESGKRFDPDRYFCGVNELMHVDGRTYAFSSQWGGGDWQEAMANLRDSFPDQEISFTASG